MQLQAQTGGGEPEALEHPARGEVVLNRLRCVLRHDGKVRGTEYAGQQIHLYSRHQMACQKRVKKRDTFPALHYPVHQLQRHRVQAERLIGHFILAESRIPLDDVAMYGVGLTQGEPELGVIKHQFGQPQAFISAFEPAHGIKLTDRVLQRLFLRGREGRGPHGPTLHRTLLDIRQQRIGHQAAVRNQLHPIVGVRIGRIGATPTFRAQAVRAGRDGKGFEQRTVGELARVTIQVIHAMLARIGGMDDQVMVINHFKMPRLGIVARGRPAREFENLRHGPGYRHYL